MLETTYLTNHFLIAMPNLDDPHFSKTVTYICMHNQEGAMGIVINRPMNIALGDVLGQMNINSNDSRANNLPLFDGGPVQPERGFVIHQPLGQWESMMTLDDNLGMTTSRDIIGAIANGQGPQDAIIALGYAGWRAGQLEKEIISNTWLSVPVDNQIIFQTPPEQRWQAAASCIGVDLTLLSCQPGHS
ncbi:MAG: YqgE/AlgH family protein [Gammaproteobacteria bacterium]|nr:MAG: YqgE/AlgH family protein [Gammaproteobacteria bacterium]RKZ74749.1 MAG: YqgE/AlgH family protein [Gammaproteobacteria bacterium]